MDPKSQAKKSKKLVSIILVITAILAIIAVIVGYYYLQINDVAPTQTKASQGCACYYVASSDSIKSCADADTKEAFQFQVGTTNSSNTCSATCDLAAASPLVSSGTPLACRLNTFTATPGCVDISIENEEEKRYANSVPTGKDLNIKAKFTIPSNSTAQEDFYNSFSFVINGEKKDFQVAQTSSTGQGASKEYVVETKLSDYANFDALTIQAIGTSKTGAQITSDACNRVITVEKPKVAACTQLESEIINDDKGTPKVSEIILSTAAITDPKTVSVKFTLGNNNTPLTTKDLSSKLANNSLVLSENFLYSTSNFIDNKSFSILNNEKSEIKISAQVYINGQIIESSNCSGTFTIPVFDGGKDTTDTDNDTPSQPTDNNNETPSEPTDNETPTDTGNTSDFIVTKSASLACVERVTPNNTVRYTITVTNRDSESENVVRVEDKLPLGFSYKANSTYINGELQGDSGLVTVEDVGESQQITFAKTGGWNVAQSGILTIRFTATVTTDALTGGNLNEVVVVPENIPENNNTLRTSVSINVSQSCTSPETGLFDSAISKVILSVFIIILGTYFYFSQNGLLFSEKLLTSSIGKFASKMSLKRNDPKKYFEETFIEKLEKDKKN